MDPKAFAEWLLNKAIRQGATRDAANSATAKFAAEVGIKYATADIVHAKCTFHSTTGLIEIDEKLTRSDAESLFGNRHPPPANPPPVEKPEVEERYPDDARRILGIRLQVLVVFTAVLLAVMFVIAVVVEKKESHTTTHDKHEMHR